MIGLRSENEVEIVFLRLSVESMKVSSVLCCSVPIPQDFLPFDLRKSQLADPEIIPVYIC